MSPEPAATPPVPAPETGGATPPPLPAWLKLLSLIPLPVLYAITGALTFIVHRVLRYRLRKARANVAACFPELPAHEQRRIVTGHYRQSGQMAAELIASARMSREEFARRMPVMNPELPRGLLEQGKPVIVLAAHQVNWEWAVLALASVLGYPLDVGYKPMHSAWAERAMHALRGRFGAHLVPAKELLVDIMRRRNIVRGIALIADQGPTTSEHQHWTRFLGRDTAFYMGPEQIARGTRYAALFLAVHRRARGRYEIEFIPVAGAGESLPPGEFTTRYARLVEAQIRTYPAGWTWGHNRWKLRRAV